MTSSKNNLSNLVYRSTLQSNPLNVLIDFLDKERRYKEARMIDKMRFVGYVLELGYDSAKIITSDTYKISVGGIPRGSFLTMVPNDIGELPYHFTLLRVKDVATTPLSNQVQQTYFELHKKSMPELDRWTQSELQWGALDCDVLGMFYANPSDSKKLSFSGDVNNVVSPHNYMVYAPNQQLLDLIVNGLVEDDMQFELGYLRTMECELGLSNEQKIPVNISLKDFRGCRTAMFGKTRLGKSNVVKLIAQGMIESAKEKKDVGQLIFDINGEYANDNPQDGEKSLRSVYEDYCVVYALTERSKTPSRPLRLNFYEQPASCMEVLRSLLQADNLNSIYIKSFYSVSLPKIDDLDKMEERDKLRSIRKIQYYWAILFNAGFVADESKLRSLNLRCRHATGFNPGFSNKLRKEAYSEAKKDLPPHPSTLQELLSELRIIYDFKRKNPNSDALTTDSGNPVFDADDQALLDFLFPTHGAGPRVLRDYRKYHDPKAGDFKVDILKLLDEGMTVILDLGNAPDKLRKYFSDMLSFAVFSHQEKKFVTNSLEDRYIQLYFEEAHNLFPVNDKELTDVYSRFAKEGAKFNIGMVYSTQSPSTISKELLAQTENFFVGHLSSVDEAKALSRLQVAYSGLEKDILRSKSPGYMRMLTRSHRFVIPVQAKKFNS